MRPFERGKCNFQHHISDFAQTLANNTITRRISKHRILITRREDSEFRAAVGIRLRTVKALYQGCPLLGRTKKNMSL
jgi:hypothetical protein